MDVDVPDVEVEVEVEEEEAGRRLGVSGILLDEDTAAAEVAAVEGAEAAVEESENVDSVRSEEEED